MPDALLEILRCPETGQPLARATGVQLSAINARKETGGAGDPQQPDTTITAALVREDGLVAYPIADGYPVLLLDRQLRSPDGSGW